MHMEIQPRSQILSKQKKMKNCELCNSVAKIHCESDQAILCLDCDSRVHGANFLVAKHLRTLLCHLCQSPTPWIGSGSKLGPTVSVCNHCVNKKACRKEINNKDEDEFDEDEDDNHHLEGEDSRSTTEVDDDDDDDDDDDAADDENQVVPWSSTSEESFKGTVHTLKRMRQTLEPASRDDSTGCSFSPRHQSVNLSNDSTSLDGFRSLKGQKNITVRVNGLQKGMVAGDV